MADSVAEPEADVAPTRPTQSLLGSIGSGLRWVVENKGIVGLVLSAYLIVKVIVVARGSQETALEIVRSAGLTQVVLGGVVSGLPFLAAAVLGLSMYRLGRHLHRFRPSPPAHWRDDFRRGKDDQAHVYLAWGITAASVLVALAFTPWSVFVAVVPIGLYLGFREAQRFDPRESKKRGMPSRMLFVGLWVIAGGMALYGLYVGILYTVWTGHESLQVNGRPTPLVGYIIDDNGGWLTMIQSGTRHVIMIDANTVKDRKVCHVQGRFERVANTSVVQWAFSLSGAHFGTLPGCQRP